MAEAAKAKPKPKRSPFWGYAIVAAVLWGILLRIFYDHTYLDSFGQWCAAGGLVTLLFYTFDKFQAQHNGWRVPELVLILLTLAGGAFGALVGMVLIGHKTNHLGFWLALLLGFALLYFAHQWLYPPALP